MTSSTLEMMTSHCVITFVRHLVRCSPPFLLGRAACALGALFSMDASSRVLEIPVHGHHEYIEIDYDAMPPCDYLLATLNNERAPLRFWSTCAVRCNRTAP